MFGHHQKTLTTRRATTTTKARQLIQEQVIKNDFLRFTNDTVYRTLILYDIFYSNVTRHSFDTGNISKHTYTQAYSLMPI